MARSEEVSGRVRPILASTSAVDDIERPKPIPSAEAPRLIEAEVPAEPYPYRGRQHLGSTNQKMGCASPTGARADRSRRWTTSGVRCRPPIYGWVDLVMSRGRRARLMMPAEIEQKNRSPIEVGEYGIARPRRREISDMRNKLHTILRCILERPSIMYRKAFNFPSQDSALREDGICPGRIDRRDASRPRTARKFFKLVEATGSRPFSGARR